jgi:ClpX C4-type zinc finger
MSARDDWEWECPMSKLKAALDEELKRDDLYCDFCGKGKAEVFLLQRGFGGHYICDECVELASTLIVKKRRLNLVDEKS